jgi:hypothetical protein
MEGYIPSAQDDWRALDLKINTASNKTLARIKEFCKAFSRHSQCCAYGTPGSLEFIATHALDRYRE